MLYPLLWMIASSFRSEDTIFSNFTLWPDETFSLRAYVEGWTGLSTSFGRFFLNSIMSVGEARSSVVFSRLGADPRLALANPSRMRTVRRIVARLVRAGIARNAVRVFRAPIAMRASLEREIDAIADSEPIGSLLVAEGKVKNVADQAKDAPYRDEYCCAVIVNGKFLKANPKAAAAATRAPLKSAKWVETNPAAAAPKRATW